MFIVFLTPQSRKKNLMKLKKNFGFSSLMGLPHLSTARAVKLLIREKSIILDFKMAENSNLSSQYGHL
jgi:hypothetical protein